MDITIISSPGHRIEGKLVEANARAFTKTKVSELKEVISANRFFNLSLNTHIFEYKAKGLFRMLSRSLGMNTWVELPTNIICKSELRYGFWLKLSTKEFSSTGQKPKTRHLALIFIPDYRLAKKSKNLMTAIIHRNMTRPNPEIAFINREIYSEAAEKQPENQLSLYH